MLERRRPFGLGEAHRQQLPLGALKPGQDRKAARHSLFSLKPKTSLGRWDRRRLGGIKGNLEYRGEIVGATSLGRSIQRAVAALHHAARRVLYVALGAGEVVQNGKIAAVRFELERGAAAVLAVVLGRAVKRSVGPLHQPRRAA